MSVQQRKRRRRSHGSPAAFSPTRLAVAGVIGAALIASAYEFAFAGGGASPAALAAGYGVGASAAPASGTGANGFPLSPLMAVPGAAGAGYAASSLGGSAASAEKPAAASAAAATVASETAAQAVGVSPSFVEQTPPLPRGVQDVTEARLVPERAVLEAGTTCSFHLEVKGADGTWYSVTNQPGARIEGADGADCLVPQEGSRNTFCLPITTSPQFADRTATFVGTFQPDGGKSVQATAKVTIKLEPDRAE